MIAILAAASLIATYNCQLDSPRAIGFTENGATASPIGLPPASMKFIVTLESGNPLQAKIDWAEDPLTVAGRFPAISTAPGAYAFSAFSAGPCLFTETSCLTQFNLVDSADGTAKIIVTPVAVASDKDAGVRSPFAVIALGQCTRKDGAK